MKKVYTIFLTISFAILNGAIVFAEGEWGENVKNWIATQASYVAIAAVLVICIPLIRGNCTVATMKCKVDSIN
ncbi:MAG: hypothetical protein JW924_04100 [Fusobacteriaceae bacterium]|nr:hypothetical protein [Fusobacteriaceae bacterium]